MLWCGTRRRVASRRKIRAFWMRYHPTYCPSCPNYGPTKSLPNARLRYYQAMEEYRQNGVSESLRGEEGDGVQAGEEDDDDDDDEEEEEEEEDEKAEEGVKEGEGEQQSVSVGGEEFKRLALRDDGEEEGEEGGEGGEEGQEAEAAAKSKGGEEEEKEGQDTAKGEDGEEEEEDDEEEEEEEEKEGGGKMESSNYD
eukprot:240455-Rhodomonas_salina.2